MTDRIAFPAWPGTTISDENGTEPVVGWVTTESGLAAITLDGQRRMIGEYVVTMPDGLDVESPIMQQAASRAEAKPSAASPKPVQTSLTPSISLTAKPFSTTSWWRYTDGTFDFMFEVPPEQDAPKKTDECQKIKRAEFTEWKKDGVPVELYIDVKEGLVLAGESEPDAEETADEDEDLI